MRQFGFVLTLALAMLAAQAGAACAQAVPSATSRFATEPFSAVELLSGTRLSEAACAALPTAVWVVVAGHGECIRYYLSAAGGSGTEPLVYFSPDVVSNNSRGEATPNEEYVETSPAQLQAVSASWSTDLHLPYILLGRPGTYGSSGAHATRRTAQEIAVVSAALDAIKARHGYTRLHLVGHTEGGHTAAALLPLRNDLGCVVLASSLLSVRAYLSELGTDRDFTGNRTPVDPIASVDRIAKRPQLRIFILTDPDDVIISARSQALYASRLVAAGLPARQVFAAASGLSAHDLLRPGHQLAAACAKAMDDRTIVATYQNKAPDVAPDAPDPPLHAAQAAAGGGAANESRCKALATGLWVHVDGRGYCVRYWISTAGGKGDETIVFFHGDIGAYINNKLELSSYSAAATSGGMQRRANQRSRVVEAPYIAIGRIGAYGSSGEHRDRARPIEARVAAAALDALKERYGFKRFHAAGQSGGGHTVAALLQKRDDIGCAVMASAAISFRSAIRGVGRWSQAAIKERYDPIDFVGAMGERPGRRMIVLSDPDDRAVSFRSQKEFVDRVRARGLPILHITAAAGDEDFHGLEWDAVRVAGDCAKGVDDKGLVARYQNKPAPAGRRR
jgi:pimeloyl-ACP methyl ester carboxylesterase